MCIPLKKVLLFSHVISVFIMSWPIIMPSHIIKTQQYESTCQSELMSPPTFLGPHVHPNWDPLSLLYSSLINAAFNYTAFPLSLSLCSAFPLFLLFASSLSSQIHPQNVRQEAPLLNSAFSFAGKASPE